MKYPTVDKKWNGKSNQKQQDGELETNHPTSKRFSSPSRSDVARTPISRSGHMRHRGVDAHVVGTK